NIGLAMIGCGQIAQTHFKGIKETPGAELVAVMDTVEEKARDASDKYGGKVYQSLDDVLADKSVDAVVLPLPHHLHCPISIQVAKSGKHILVEKPMALNLTEAQKMVNAADNAGVHLMIGQSTRFQPEVWKAKELINEGKLGNVNQCICIRAFFTEKLSTEWRYSPEQCGGLYLPIFASHDVDMILWLMEDMPLSVQSLLRSFTPLVDSESDGNLNMELANGKIASLSFSMNSHITRQSTLFIGSQGTMLIEGGKLWVNKDEIVLDKSQNAFTRQMREFISSIKENREPVSSGRNVLPVMAVLDAARKSADNKCTINIKYDSY
ncbi:Gfo/Idh/MocA family oxidoreductase, partial [Candidatus Poribacteria bacterium]|nr:Gfo/Idh/MocA family oxidoreductase [Candidatus Poribacteria bacterium]